MGRRIFFEDVSAETLVFEIPIEKSQGAGHILVEEVHPVRAGTTCFHVSKPPRGVSNMVVPSWNHVFLRVQATQGKI